MHKFTLRYLDDSVKSEANKFNHSVGLFDNSGALIGDALIALSIVDSPRASVVIDSAMPIPGMRLAKHQPTCPPGGMVVIRYCVPKKHINIDLA